MATQDNTVVDDVLAQLGDDQVSASEQDLGAEAEAPNVTDPVADDGVDTDEPQGDHKSTLAQDKNEWRRRARRAERRLAEAEAGSLVPQEQIVEAPKEPSPLEVWTQENEDYPDATPPGRVLLADRQFQRQHEQAVQQAQDANADRQALARGIAAAKVSMDEEAMGESLDFDSVVAAGSIYLTERQKATVRTAGEDAGQVLYNFCLRHAKEADTDAGDRIRAAGSAPSKQSTQSTLTKRQDQPPTRRETLREQPSAAPTFAERLGIRWADEPPG